MIRPGQVSAPTDVSVVKLHRSEINVETEPKRTKSYTTILLVVARSILRSERGMKE